VSCCRQTAHRLSRRNGFDRTDRCSLFSERGPSSYSYSVVLIKSYRYFLFKLESRDPAGGGAAGIYAGSLEVCISCHRNFMLRPRAYRCCTVTGTLEGVNPPLGRIDLIGRYMSVATFETMLLMTRRRSTYRTVSTDHAMGQYLLRVACLGFYRGALAETTFRET
jgi:hypothetical protein